MAVRHLDAELRHRQKQSLAHQTSTSSGRGEKEEILPSSRRPISVFALHPGEVATDMASNVNVPWTVEGVLSVRESVEGCLRTIEARRVEESGTVWTWEGKVSKVFFHLLSLLLEVVVVVVMAERKIRMTRRCANMLAGVSLVRSSMEAETSQGRMDGGGEDGGLDCDGILGVS